MSGEFISLGARLRELACAQPDAPAVSCGADTLTYAELHRRTNRIARGLAELGVRTGDLVTVGLPNSVEFVEACWGLWKLGATPQPASYRLPAAELGAIVELANARLVLGRFEFALHRAVMDVAAVAASAGSDADLPDAVAPIMKAPTSGGSTGRPKLILSGTRGETTRDPEATWGWDLRPDSLALIPAPLYHNAGFGMMLSAINRGAHLVIMPRFDAEQALAEIERRRATWVYLVPTMMNRIWQLPPDVRGRYDVSSLRSLWHLAAPCPPWLKAAFIEWLGPEVVMELYAGTEGQASTIISGAEWLAHRGSVGRVVFGEMRVFSGEGAPLPPGTVGEIYMRRPPGSPATYTYRGAEAKRLADGWESLGDVGWIDEQGYVYISDRRSDMILVGGSNVYPAEVEAALERHPGVLSSAVIGLPDGDLGARVHAVVQAEPHVSEESLMAHLREQLVSYKLPRSIEFVAEPLRDDAGKVRRSALRDARLAPANPTAN